MAKPVLWFSFWDAELSAEEHCWNVCNLQISDAKFSEYTIRPVACENFLQLKFKNVMEQCKYKYGCTCDEWLAIINVLRSIILCNNNTMLQPVNVDS